MLAELDDIEKTALDQLAGVTAPDGLEAWRIEWLGSKGHSRA